MEATAVVTEGATEGSTDGWAVRHRDTLEMWTTSVLYSFESSGAGFPRPFPQQGAEHTHPSGLTPNEERTRVGATAISVAVLSKLHLVGGGGCFPGVHLWRCVRITT